MYRPWPRHRWVCTVPMLNSKLDRMEHRTCKKCRFPKPLDRFSQYKGRDGVMRPRGTCWDCRDNRNRYTVEELRAYRKTYNQNKASERHVKQATKRLVAKAFTDKAKDVPCADCGRNWPAVAMDFDHVRGVKIGNIASMVSSGYKIDLIKAEVAKCDVVCACCHRIRTASRGDNIGQQLFRASDVDPALLLSPRNCCINPATAFFSLHTDGGLQTDDDPVPF